MRRAPAIVLVVLLSILAAGCGGSSNKASSDTTGTAAAASCKKSDLNLVNSGQLTAGTDNPAFPPWFGGNEKAPWKVSDPYSGQGYESAVTYAVAKKLGFAKSEVKWIVVPFNTAFAPGPKKFDFDINQISYKPARAKAVDFSDSYYDVNQALVVDLPTAFYVTAVQVPNGKILGQFPTVGTPEHFGMVFEKGNSLVSCVNDALAQLRADGTLKSLQAKWLQADAPVLK